MILFVDNNKGFLFIQDTLQIIPSSGDWYGLYGIPYRAGVIGKVV